MIVTKTMDRKNFLVIGRAGLDLYAEPIGTRIENAVSFSAQLGGSAGNIAVGLAKQNCQCSLLTGISEDAIGKFTRNYLSKSGVSTELVYQFSSNKNSLAIVDTNGDDTQASIYRNSPADLQIRNEFFNDINLMSFSTVIVTGTALTENPSRDLVIKIMKTAKQLGKEVILDVDYRSNTWNSQEEALPILKEAVHASSVIVGNEIEFDFMSGKVGGGETLANELGESDNKIIIYKMGEQGCIILFDKERTKFDTYNVQAIKPTGAGDAFLAGFCATFENCENINQAVLAGAASAAIVVTKVGCSNAMPDKTEVKEFLQINKKPNIKRI